jgi:DNA-binding CsgD family transcriptional regulator
MSVSSPTGSDDTLLEREAELDAIEGALDAVDGGTGQLVLFEASAGAGKTRLLEFTRHRAQERGFVVLHARAAALEQEFPFGVVLQLFEPRLRSADDDERARLLSGAAAFASSLFEVGGERQARVGQLPEGDAPYATLHGLFWLCANLAAEAPVVISVDDVHWADAPSRRFLSYLLRRLEGLPALTALTMRPAESPAGDDLIEEIASSPTATVMRPPPLSPAAVEKLVHARLSDKAVEAFTLACHELTAGNPLLLRELLRELADARLEPTETGARRLRRVSPRSISRIVPRRLERLAEPARALARAVAVLDGHADLRYAAALAELDHAEAADAARLLADVELLHPGPELSFIHPIVRAAVYRDMRSADRARLHARAARTLHSEHAPIDQVVAHLLATHPASDAWVVETLRTAAERAMAQGTPAAAISYLRRALEEPPPAAAVPELTAELGAAETRARDPSAIEHLTLALEMTAEPERRAAIGLDLGRALTMGGRLGDAIALLEGIISELGDDHGELALRLEAELLAAARLGIHTRPLVAARLESLREHAEERGPAERALLANLAYEAVIQGDPAQRAAELAARALGGGALLADEGSESPTYYYAAWALALCDRLVEATEALDAAIADARAHGSGLGFGLASCFRSNVCYRRGLVADAEADARHALAVASHDGLEASLPLAIAFLIDALIERGELNEAEETLDRSGLGAELPDLIAFNPLLVSRATLRILQGRTEEGLADFLENGRRGAAWGARTPAFFAWRSCAALALEKLGRHDEALELAGAELELARAFGAPRPLGTALRAAGLISDGRERIARLEEAVTVLESSPAALEHARALVDLGAALRRANRRSAARERLRAGFRMAGECGATTLAQRAREELAATGAKPRGAAHRDVLTASERRVAQMAAQGLANRQIAAALFVTPKTVEWHLGQAYRKLGVHSRRELPGVLDDPGKRPTP